MKIYEVKTVNYLEGSVTFKVMRAEDVNDVFVYLADLRKTYPKVLLENTELCYIKLVPEDWVFECAPEFVEVRVPQDIYGGILRRYLLASGDTRSDSITEALK